MSDAARNNEHVFDFLTYYLGFAQPPHYAVMLNGPWGIGKTSLLKSFIAKASAGGKKVVYVSLYGLNTLEEIDDALFRSMYPFINNKATKISSRAIRSAGKFFRLETDLTVSDFFDKTKADLFVFDDLERCEISVNRVLGYINDFVEHEDCKVIIVANESEIKNEEEYGRIREKLIGKTLEIQSSVSEIIPAFVDSLKNPDTHEFVATQVDVIKDIYNQSGLHNLRILQQTMWDFERFYIALQERHRENSHAMSAVFRMLCAISMELKSGRLKETDLRNRRHAVVASYMRTNRNGAPPSAFSQANSRYPGANIDSNALSDEAIIGILVKGIISVDAIRAELDASSFFVVVADEPSWRTVWYGYERTQEEFDAALAKMKTSYSQRDYDVIGEILHVFGLRLWLSKIGVIDTSLSEVVENGKRYVDELYDAKRLKSASHTDLYSVQRESGFDGLGVHENETEEYRELANYLHRKRQQVAIDEYPNIAEELLSSLVKNSDEFFGRIALISGGKNDLYRVPVLAYIEPNKFVETLLSLHPSRQLR